MKNYKRLNWNQIEELYPDQWVGMTDVEYFDNHRGKIKSAVVKEATSTYEGMGEMTKKTLKGELVMRYTTPDNDIFVPLMCGANL